MNKTALFKILDNLKTKLDSFSKKYDETLKKNYENLSKLSDILWEIHEASSYSWIGHQSEAYHLIGNEFTIPPPSEGFDIMSGHPRSVNWKRIPYIGIQQWIENKTGLNISTIRKQIIEIMNETQQIQEEIITDLSILKELNQYKTEIATLDEINNMKWGVPESYLVKQKRPSNFFTRDMQALNLGMRTPPHIEYLVNVESSQTKIYSIRNFIKLANRLITQIKIREDLEIKVQPTDLETYYNLIEETKENFRATIIKEPINESDVQDYYESFLKSNKFDFNREKDQVLFSEKLFVPDFTSDEFKMAIEVKFVKDNKTKSVVIEGMSADLKPYSKKWDKILYIVYDKGGNINDGRKFTKDFNEETDELRTVCLVIKH